MHTKKQSSFNGQVYKKAYKRLKLTPTQRVVFQRLLGFLIRNDKPFPFSTTSLSELTGYSKRTIVRVLSRLEYLRLIKRLGMANNRRFKRGSILYKILTTAPYSSTIILANTSTATPLCPQKLNSYAMVAHNKTSCSLKLKEKDPPIQDQQNYSYYKNNPQFSMPDNLKYVGDWVKVSSVGYNL